MTQDKVTSCYRGSAEADAERFRYLQNLPVVQAQAYFWNWSSRKQRAKVIDEDRAAEPLPVEKK